MYFPNPELGSAGVKVLELAEQLRRHMLQDTDTDSPEPSVGQDSHDIKHLTSELDRARSRIQGNTLRNLGSTSDDLWHTALKMLCLGRIVTQRRTKPPPTILPYENRRPIQDSSTLNGTYRSLELHIGIEAVLQCQITN